ncbi:uncharacterized protein LOC134855275 isoform X2 [Symsagittifera roscoffensis]|uniref:uncharacterized protein LOC134855275 isoform X2 n=1 Tax=Symsagittifera roscoffensis TaxID=84072 RepID=UPI00307C67C1
MHLSYFIFAATFHLLTNTVTSRDPQLLKVDDIGITTASICWLVGSNPMLQDFHLIINPLEIEYPGGPSEPMIYDAARALNLREKACYEVKELQGGTEYTARLTWRDSVYKQQYSISNVTFRTEENPCNAFGCVSGNCQMAINDGGKIDVSCVCFLGYYGHRCELHNPCILDPCDDFPCSNTSTNTYNCICPNGREVDSPEKCRHIKPCDEEPCGLNGICKNENSFDFTCQCNDGYFGSRCERMNPCNQVNCHNGGKCVNETNTNFHCDCVQGFMGPFCDQRNPCDRDHNPCQNSGKCIPDNSNLRGFICQCDPGFSGTLCEENDPCASNPCKPFECVPQDNSEFMCKCPPRYYGKVCQHEDLCKMENVCKNGLCDMDGKGSFKCTCHEGWLGTHCEIKDQCKSHSNPCKHGGDCRMDVTMGTYSCKCPDNSGFWGRNCEYFNECRNNPCKHQGICRNMTYGRDGRGEYNCECMGNFQGKDCEEWNHCKTPGYCEYQGECSFVGHNNSVCKCRTGYYGNRCENYNICEVNNPCQNKGICRPQGDNGYTCTCLGGYTGKNCELFDPCQITQCRNGGVCVTTDEILGTFTCNCHEPFYGTRCERENYCRGKESLCDKEKGFTCRNLTTMHYVCEPINPNVLIGICQQNRDCLHGGICLSDGSCDCKPPYSGRRCEVIEPCKDPNVCSSNGECVLSIDGKNAECKCAVGFFGSKCELHDPCLMKRCNNGGNCVQLNPKLTPGTDRLGVQTVCHCPLGYKGDDCSVMNKECINNECLNGGLCIEAISSSELSSMATTYFESEGSATFPSAYTKSTKSYLAKDNFVCKCPDKYKGRRCETLRQCLGKTEKLEKGKGIIEWKSTAMGQVSLAACPFGSQSLYSVQQLEKGAGFAQRDCMLVDRMDGKEAQWDVPNTDNCDPEPQSDQEAEAVLDSVLVLMMEADPWEHSPESIEYAGTVLRNLATTYVFRSLTMAKKFFQVIDRLLDIPSQISFEAEVRYGAISRLLSDLDMFMDSFIVADLPNPVIIDNKNIRVIWVTHTTLYKESQRNPQFTFAQPEFDLKLHSKLFASKEANQKHRIQIILFNQNSLFLSQRISSFGQPVPETENSPKTTRILNVNIKGRNIEAASSESIQISFQVPYEDKFIYHCAFWQPSNRKWETVGLVTEVFQNSTVCKSTHLTSFTVLKMNTGRLGGAAPPSVLPFVGCGIACIAYSLLAVTYAIVRSARRNVAPGVVVHLSVSLLLLNISMMFASIKDRINPFDLCSLVSIAMHYLICSSLMWYCVEGLFRFRETSLANNSSVFYKCAVIAWGVPAIISGSSVAVKMGLTSISDTYCRITPEQQYTFYSLLLLPTIVFLAVASILYILHIFKFGSGNATRTYTQSQTLSPNNASYLTNTSKASASQTILVLITMGVFVFNWVINQLIFDPSQIYIFDFAFCFGNVIQSMLLFSTLCLLSDDARYAWHYFWAPSQNNPKPVPLANAKLTYSDAGTLLSNGNGNKITMHFGATCNSPSISPNSPKMSPSRNGKYPNTNGTLTRNPVYSNHDSDKFNSMNDVRSAVANGAVIFGETREIKQAVACLNTQGSFGSSVSSGLNPDTNSDRFQRGDPYAASYPQATTLFRDDPSPTFSNPERESYV